LVFLTRYVYVIINSIEITKEKEVCDLGRLIALSFVVCCCRGNIFCF